MELIGLIGIAVILGCGWLFWTKVRQARGYDEPPVIEGEAQLAIHELQVVAPTVKFKGFSIRSPGEGRLFITADGHLVFANPSGTQVAINIPRADIIGFQVKNAGFFAREQLAVRFSRFGREEEMCFRLQDYGLAAQARSDPKETFSAWIAAVEQLLEQKSSGTAAGEAIPQRAAEPRETHRVWLLRTIRQFPVYRAQDSGPHTADEIRSLLQAGKARKGDFVSRLEEDAFRRIEETDEFENAAGKS